MMRSRYFIFALGVCLLLFGLWVFGWSIAAPENEKAVNWLDYWLNRYQTLITGILAIVGAGFAIFAANMSIWYDREKTKQAAEETCRASIRTIAQTVRYAANMLSSKHLIVSHSRQFPADVFPSALLDTDTLKRSVIAGLANLPANVGMRCLYLVHAMELNNSFIQNRVMTSTAAPLPFEQNFANKLPVLIQMEGLMLCCDIVWFQLIYIAFAPRDEWKPEEFDAIDQVTVDYVAAERQVSKKHAAHFLSDLKLRVVEGFAKTGPPAPGKYV